MDTCVHCRKPVAHDGSDNMVAYNFELSFIGYIHDSCAHYLACELEEPQGFIGGGWGCIEFYYNEPRLIKVKK